MEGFGHGVANSENLEATQNPMRISCIIPTLNRDSVLVDTIGMLRSQTNTAYEIIVVDQTQNIDSKTAARLQNWNDQGVIKWLRQSEPNASKARNAGAIVATGDVLLFLDDDIQVSPDFVTAHERNYRDPAILAVSGQVLEAEKTITTTLRFPPEDPDVGWIRFPKNYAQRCITSWMAAGNFSVRRDVYFEIGGMDENYRRGAFREETDFAMRFLRARHRFQFDPEASIVHLGAGLVKQGGARNWSSIFAWHHYIGAWYFAFGFSSRRNVFQVIWTSFRHLVARRSYLSKPWVVPICAVCWFIGIPIALCLRVKGAKTLKVGMGARN